MSTSYKGIWLEWLDHGDPTNDPSKVWHNMSDLNTEPSRIQTLGFLVEETKDLYIVAHSYGVNDVVAGDEEQQGAGFIAVLKKAVVRKRMVKLT